MPNKMNGEIKMKSSHKKADILRNAFERDVFDYYDNKRKDALNLSFGDVDGYYHHHFAVGDFDRSVLASAAEEREDRILAEMHRLESEQVNIILDGLGDVAPSARVLDAGSGRGGTSFIVYSTFGCRVDGVNISSYQNDFARNLAALHDAEESVRFHDRNMADTGFDRDSFDYVVSNETTMYVHLPEAFKEFARVLKPGGRYVLTTWCRDDSVAPHSQEANDIDIHYHCHTHRRSSYLRELLKAGLVPRCVDDLTLAATPYWELRSQSSLRSGIEDAYLNGYRTGRVNYMRIIADKELEHRS